MDKLGSENSVKIPMEENLSDNFVANEVVDVIRRMFGAYRMEDQQNWIYVTR